jgi:hypothetical protein
MSASAAASAGSSRTATTTTTTLGIVPPQPAGQVYSSKHWQQAFDQAVSDLCVQELTERCSPMRVLMHGAGDVIPTEIEASTCHLVSTLTVQYITKLVDAALDAQAMLRDGAIEKKVTTSSRKRSKRSEMTTTASSLPPWLPPPPHLSTKKRRQFELVPPPFKSRSPGNSRSEEFWDEPLPEPVIKGKTPRTAAARNEHDCWVGALGVDIQENLVRSVYAGAVPAVTIGSSHSSHASIGALGPQALVFPICHDPYAFGRVTEMLAASQSVASLLVDPVVDTILAEGQRPKRRRLGHKKSRKDAAKSEKKKTDSENEEDDEDEDSDEEEEEDKNGSDDDEEDEDEDVMSSLTRLDWLGLQSLLPVRSKRES